MHRTIPLIANLILLAVVSSTTPQALAEAPPDSLTLESTSCAAGPGDTLQVELWLRNPQQPISGFQAFVQFDPAALTYLGIASCYTKCTGATDPPCGNGPFQLYFPADVSNAGNFSGAQPGELNISGSTGFTGPCAAPASADARIAILSFQVNAGLQCATTSVDFRDWGALSSELSDQGIPVPTSLVATGELTLDGAPPQIACPEDVTVSCQAFPDIGETGMAGAIDDCGEPALEFSDSIAMGEGDPELIVTRTWTATDACGHTTQCVQTITVTPSLGDGDVNGDGFVDGLDVQPMIELMIEGGTPGPAFCAADMNADLQINDADAGLLVSALLAG